MRYIPLLLIFLGITTSIFAAPTTEEECVGPTTLSTYIGKDHNVHVEVTRCANLTPQTSPLNEVLESDNVCGATCAYFLTFTPKRRANRDFQVQHTVGRPLAAVLTPTSVT